MPDQEDQKSYYEKDGLQFPRVTHVIKVVDKAGLARWRGRVGNSEADRLSQEGSRIGSEFHEVIQEIHMGRHVQRGWQAPGEFRFMADAYIDWIHKWVGEVHLFEQSYFSNDHHHDEQCAVPCEYTDEPLYAGTIDLLATIRGDRLPSIIDVKTSNSYSDDWPLQLSGYRRLMKINGIDTQRRIIVRIPKVGKVDPEVFDYSKRPGANEEDEQAWLDVLKIWKWKQKEKERRKDALVVSGL